MENSRKLPTYAAPDKRRKPASNKAGAGAGPTIVAAKAADPAMVALVATVDAARLISSVKALATTFTTRHSLSPHNVDAAKFLRDQFVALGYTDVKLHDFTMSGVTRHNVVCTKPGSTNAAKFIIVGGHYDSRGSNLGSSTAAAPGADDNASGTAALLELARVLKSVDLPCSVQFVAFSGEEQGLLGSTAYADAVNAAGMDIRMMINLDMIGHSGGVTPPKIHVERDEGNDVAANDAPSQAAAAEMASLALTYTSLQPEVGPMFDSDYMPFEHFGYACIGLFDGADSQPFYHSAQDTPDKVHSAYHTDAVRLALATIVTIARQ